MKDAISYVRISTKDQSQYSLEYQESAIRQYCKVNALNLIGLFKDNGERSYTFDRPDWKELEKFIKKNKSVKYLIIYDHDRFSRNLAEAILKIKELYDKYNITVLATTEGIETDNSDISTYLLRSFKYMMGESELMRIRDRTKAGLRYAAINGYYTNRAPFGYKPARTSDGKPTLEIDAIRGPVIKKIFKLHSQGVNPEAIRRLVKPLFTLTNKSAIQDIIRNPIYMGMIKVGAYKNNPAHYVKGKHPGIVSEAEFINAQREHKSFTAQANDEVPLRGVLKCWCGRLVTAGNSRNKIGKYYWYYLCNEHRKNYSAIKLHDQMNEILTTLSLSTQDVELIKDRFAFRMGEMMQEINTNGEAVKQELNDVNRQIKSVEKKYLSNTDISESTFREMLTELRNKKAEAEKKIRLQSVIDIGLMRTLEVMLPKLLDLKYAYTAMPVDKKRRFLKIVFGENLTYEENAYQTPDLADFFQHKALILKEKGLLNSEPLVENAKVIPLRIPQHTPIEHLTDFLMLFAV